MNRQDTVSTLRKAEPALGSKDQIAPFQAFRFDGRNAVAYNDVVAISVPCALKPGGGLAGNLLLDWLSASGSEEFDIELVEGDAKLRSGRSTIKVPIVPDGDFLFEFHSHKDAMVIEFPLPRVPKSKKDAEEAPPENGFVTALRRAALCVGQDQNHPWRLGVTAVPSKEGLSLYSSDNVTAARAIWSGKAGKGDPFIMPPRFVDLLMGFAAKGEILEKLVISGDKWVEAVFAGPIRLWSRGMSDIQLDNYTGIFQRLLGDLPGKPVDIPQGLDGCLVRLALVLKYGNDSRARASIAKGRLSLRAVNAAADVHDEISVPGHPDGEVSFAPEFVRRALAESTQVVFSGSCIYLRSEGFDYIAAPVSGGAKEPAAEEPAGNPQADEACGDEAPPEANPKPRKQRAAAKR